VAEGGGVSHAYCPEDFMLPLALLILTLVSIQWHGLPHFKFLHYVLQPNESALRGIGVWVDA